MTFDSNLTTPRKETSVVEQVFVKPLPLHEFYTPQQQHPAKPVPSAFHSTGFLLKKNISAQEPLLGSSNRMFKKKLFPETPVKQRTLPSILGKPDSSNDDGFPSTPLSSGNNRKHRVASPPKTTKRMHHSPPSLLISSAQRTPFSPQTMGTDAMFVDRRVETLSPLSKGRLFSTTNHTARHRSRTRSRNPSGSSTGSNLMALDSNDNAMQYSHTRTASNSSAFAECVIPFAMLNSHIPCFLDQTCFNALHGDLQSVQKLRTTFDAKEQEFVTSLLGQKKKKKPLSSNNTDLRILELQFPMHCDYFDSHFHVVRQLGGGHFAEAYHVTCVDDRMEYAVKKTKKPFTGFKDA